MKPVTKGEISRVRKKILTAPKNNTQFFLDLK